MIIYVGNNGNRTLVPLIAANPRLGFMLTPSDLRHTQHRHALDNGAYSVWRKGEKFKALAFEKALKRMTNPDFIVIPDIVAGGMKSLTFSKRWLRRLPEGINYYLAVQDGMSTQNITPRLIKQIKGIFVGGSKRWKYQTAEMWVCFAHEHHLKCHIGRVGTLRRLLWAERIGADSVDSSNFAKHPKNWHQLIEFLKGGQTRLA